MPADTLGVLNSKRYNYFYERQETVGAFGRACYNPSRLSRLARIFLFAGRTDWRALWASGYVDENNF